MTRIGLISDTHGLLRPQALDFLAGCARILHMGDVCEPSVLEALARIAPVQAVRGNNDVGPWADALPLQRTEQVDGVRLHLLHDLKDLELDPVAEGIAVVLSGHSHRPTQRSAGAVLYLNPGSAGPRRFSLPVSVGELWIEGDQVRAELHTLEL